MKSPLSRLSLLKGLLLLVLAANFSWKPIWNQLSSIELAQVESTPPNEVGGARDCPTGFNDRTSSCNNRVAGEFKELSQAPANLRVYPIKPIFSGTTTPKVVNRNGVNAGISTRVAGPPQTNTTAKPQLKCTNNKMVRTNLKECNQNFQVIFSQCNDRSDQNSASSWTKVTLLKEDEHAAAMTSKAYQGDLAANYNNEANRAEILLKEGQRLRTEGVVSCDSDSTKKETADSKPGRGKDTVKNLDEKVKNCERDVAGEKLGNTDKISCFNNRLEALEDLDSDEKEDRKKVLASMKELVDGPLTDTLMELLTSDDKEDIKDGQILAKEMREKIMSLGNEFDLDRDEVTKLVNKLYALEAGGDTYQRSSKYQADAEKLLNEYNRAHAYSVRNPNSPYATHWLTAVQTQLANLNLAGVRDMSSIYNPRGAYGRLLGFETDGLISAMEMESFIAPYKKFQDSMSEVFGTNLFTLPGTPLDYIDLDSPRLATRSGALPVDMSLGALSQAALDARRSFNSHFTTNHGSLAFTPSRFGDVQYGNYGLTPGALEAFQIVAANRNRTLIQNPRPTLGARTGLQRSTLGTSRSGLQKSTMRGGAPTARPSRGGGRL